MTARGPSEETHNRFHWMHGCRGTRMLTSCVLRGADALLEIRARSAVAHRTLRLVCPFHRSGGEVKLWNLNCADSNPQKSSQQWWNLATCQRLKDCSNVQLNVLNCRWKTYAPWTSSIQGWSSLLLALCWIIWQLDLNGPEENYPPTFPQLQAGKWGGGIHGGRKMEGGVTIKRTNTNGWEIQEKETKPNDSYKK